jgi:serpin B
MIIVLPEQRGGLPALEKKLTAAQVSGWMKNLTQSRTVQVYLPRFKTTAEFQLNSVLAAMGMPDPFDPQRADFTGMNSAGELYISAVLHKAYVDVNEEGTEAAAATGVVVGVTSAPVDPPPVFRADHPFVYLIRDNTTQSILFLGRLMNPTK